MEAVALVWTSRSLLLMACTASQHQHLHLIDLDAFLFSVNTSWLDTIIDDINTAEEANVVIGYVTILMIDTTIIGYNVIYGDAFVCFASCLDTTLGSTVICYSNIFCIDSCHLNCGRVLHLILRLPYELHCWSWTTKFYNIQDFNIL